MASDPSQSLCFDPHSALFFKFRPLERRKRFHESLERDIVVVDWFEANPHLKSGGGEEPLEGGESRLLSTCLVRRYGLLGDASRSSEFGLCDACLVSRQSQETGSERWCRIVFSHVDRLHNLSAVYNRSYVYNR